MIIQSLKEQIDIIKLSEFSPRKYDKDRLNLVSYKHLPVNAYSCEQVQLMNFSTHLNNTFEDYVVIHGSWQSSLKEAASLHYARRKWNSYENTFSI